MYAFLPRSLFELGPPDISSRSSFPALPPNILTAPPGFVIPVVLPYEVASPFDAPVYLLVSNPPKPKPSVPAP